jgi:hypothetical protein
MKLKSRFSFRSHSDSLTYVVQVEDRPIQIKKRSINFILKKETFVFT